MNCTPSVYSKWLLKRDVSVQKLKLWNKKSKAEFGNLCGEFFFFPQLLILTLKDLQQLYPTINPSISLSKIDEAPMQQVTIYSAVLSITNWMFGYSGYTVHCANQLLYFSGTAILFWYSDINWGNVDRQWWVDGQMQGGFIQ